jgi:hypothetical protein
LRLLLDKTGTEFENIKAALAEAQKALQDMPRDALPDDNHRTFVVSVRDEAGQVVWRVAFSLVVEESTLVIEENLKKVSSPIRIWSLSGYPPVAYPAFLLGRPTSQGRHSPTAQRKKT